MASFSPRVNEKEIGEAQDGEGAREQRAGCEGAGAGAGGEAGRGGDIGKSYAKALEKRGSDAEAQEKRGGEDRRRLAGGSGPTMGVGRE